MDQLDRDQNIITYIQSCIFSLVFVELPVPNDSKYSIGLSKNTIDALYLIHFALFFVKAYL